MNLISSIKSLFHVVREDMALAKIGAPLGWLFHLHYEGRWAERTQRNPRHKKVLLHHHGRQIHVELSASYEGAFKGVFLDNEYQCDHLVAGSPSRILDLGANIGMGTLYLKMLFPEAEFICVEPDPRNLPLLMLNLEANKVKFKVEKVAVAAKPGILQLRFGSNPTCSALETSSMHELEHSVPVTVKTVVEILDSAGWASVDLLKIDIEGVEDELLSTDNNWLHRIKALILEIHPNTTPERIASFLRPYGFELKRVGYGVEPVYFASRPLISELS